jgi:hypothetical protein
MEVLFQLPLPTEICWKILYYTIKSPYEDLGLGVLKHFTYTDNDHRYNEKDKDFITFDIMHYDFINYMKPFNIFKLGMFTNITQLCLEEPGTHTGITGDIQVLQFMPNLTNLAIANMYNIYGDICHLSSLFKLKDISLDSTKLYGNIENISSLHNLQTLYISDINICGNINTLKYLKKLFHIYLINTLIYNHENDGFHDYRKKNNLPSCKFIMFKGVKQNIFLN